MPSYSTISPTLYLTPLDDQVVEPPEGRELVIAARVVVTRSVVVAGRAVVTGALYESTVFMF